MGMAEGLADFDSQVEGIQGFYQESLNTGFECGDPGFFLSTPSTQDHGQILVQAPDLRGQGKPV